MDLEQLKHFVKVAEHQNFTKAAEAVHLSQSALSRSIAKLEASLGKPLFERQARRVKLTESGQLILEKARKMLTLADEIKAEINDDGESGRIRVGAIPTIAPFFLPAFLREFGKTCPDSRVVLDEDTTENLVKKLADGDVDLAILARPLEVKHLQLEDMFEEELLLVTPMDHPLNELADVTLDDLQSLPFVLLGEAHCLTEHIVGFCQQKAFHPVSVERTSQLASVQELVALGHGISLIPAMARELDQSPDRMYRSVGDPEDQKPKRTISACWNPYRFQSKLMTRFREAITEYARETYLR